ncbi:methyltransferase domain-containing protein [Aquihabitans sp. G128]|uniref:methyltransferase domain-containing protein n=1 Tax=Aquihabitans sp. G128 TaxID=2849779 RepID=UPI001C24F8E6|nr:methyltransferase domain-containing protein [Aquihabitans sp. G128]QXC63118.1 methyltransferase domain-containing protein [Aquihabitans sp. G128]
MVGTSGARGDRSDAGAGGAPPARLLARLAEAAAAGSAPPAALLAELRTAFAPELEAAAEAPEGDPYSRQVVHAAPEVEVMVARWRPGARCAPHDHGGSSGFVVAVEGSFAEVRYGWTGADLLPVEELAHPAGEAFGFGPEVVHDMAAGSSGLSLHVYAPAPAHMHVYDLDAGEVLDLVGDFGAWIPAGEHPRTPFADLWADAEVAGTGAAPVAEASTTEATELPATELPAAERPVIWVAHTTRYRGGSAEFATAAETMRRELAADHPEADVELHALDGKADLVAEMTRLDAAGRCIAELHFVGHAGMYGPMFGSVDWPEQFSPHEWQALEIPFAPGATAWFHACRTARWFAPFFARTFGVTTYGNQGYTTVSARKDRFAWAGRTPEARRDLYLVAVPGKKTHGWAGSVRKYAGAAVEPMVACSPEPLDPTKSYDPVAELYDRAYVDIRVREAEWAWVTAHAEEARAALGRPLRVVEVGCGNGALLRQLDERGDLGSGVGLDDSAGMVERAASRSGDHPNLRFDRIVGPVIDLPDASVDVALSFLSFRYLDWDPLMAEVRRVLAPGGRLWVVDMVERPVRLRDVALLARSTLTHLRMPKRHPQFAVDLQALTSHPDWKAMVRHNPIRAEHEYRWYLESRFPGQRLEVLTATTTQRVVAFDSGPLERGATAPLSYP